MIVTGLTVILFAVVSPEALTAYEQGRYGEAETLLAAAPAELRDAETWYNIATARARQQQWASALAAYTVAAETIPRDPDLVHNVRFVRSKLGNPSAAPCPGHPEFCVGVNKLAPSEARTLFVVGAWAWLCAVILWHFVRPRMRRLARALLVAATLGLVCTAAIDAFRQHLAARDLAVLLQSAPAQSDPTDGGHVLFTIPAGTSVIRVARQGAWSRVNAVGQSIWLRDATLFSVRSPP